MLNVCTWKWQPPQGYRSTFTGEQVNVLAAMVRRHYRKPHTFTCFTDDATGIDQEHVTIKQLPTLFADVISPHGIKGPSCYRRLNMFAPQAGKTFGERFVSLDLDTVIVGDMVPLWDREEDFVIWGDTALRTSYNGSMVLMKAGTRPQIFTEFDPVNTPKLTKKLGMTGSDQAWISHRLGPDEPKWTKADGVYSYRLHIVPRPRQTLPDNARIVFFHGSFDPWDPRVQRGAAWITDHYRL